MYGYATHRNARRWRPRWKIARHFCRRTSRGIHIAECTDQLGQIKFMEHLRLRCTCTSLGCAGLRKTDGVEV